MKEYLTVFDYIFIDLDGPILDGKLRHYNCYVDILKKYDGIPLSINEYWESKRNKVSRDVLLKKSGFSYNYETYLHEWVTSIERPEYLQYDVLKPRVSETLEAWKQNYSRKLVLVTMRQNRQNLLVQLKQLDILNMFDEVIDCNPFINEPKYTMLKEIKFNRAIFIGDTEEDVYTARKLDIPIIGILNGLRNKDYLHADRYVDEICQIVFELE